MKILQTNRVFPVDLFAVILFGVSIALLNTKAIHGNRNLLEKSHFVGLRRMFGLLPVPENRQSQIEDTLLRFYDGPSISNSIRIPFNNIQDLMTLTRFNDSRPTVIYIHGFGESHTDESIITVLDAYLKSGYEANIMIFDWSNMVFSNYILASINVENVGIEIGKQLSRLARAGSASLTRRLHLVGHSLGAHVAGHIGKEFRKNGMTVSRISALDAALPGFYPKLFGPRLTKSDASFVDAIHTDSGYFGTPLSIGHVDFWPNGGLPLQPGCAVSILLSDEDFCSHQRSWHFWSESVRSRRSFPALACASLQDLKAGSCEGGKVAYMGDAAAEYKSLRGNFYLTTNSNPPYGKGIDGIISRQNNEI